MVSTNVRRRLKRFAISATIAVVATILAGVLVGPTTAFAVGVIGFLGVAFASDDNLGTCLPLAVLLLIGLALLLMVLIATIKIHT